MLESLENIKKCTQKTHKEKKNQPKSHHTGMDAFKSNIILGVENHLSNCSVLLKRSLAEVSDYFSVCLTDFEGIALDFGAVDGDVI